MTKFGLRTGCAIIALSIAAQSPAWAQTAPATPPADAVPEAAAPDATTPDAAAPETGGDIIVTGSARQQRRFDVSYAVNSLSNADIQKLAPINFADLLGKLPGFAVENTGGEVQNIIRLRGLPSDGGLVTFQQDGLPMFHENDGNFFRGDSINRFDLMTQRVEVVRGGPAPVYASYAAAIVNNITVSGTDTTRGKAQVTLGDTGLYRLDAYQAGPIDDSTYYAIGGFLRRHDGYRDNGFPNDRGGQVRANIKHDFSNGSLRVSGNYLNDHNVFYLPIPTADPRDPSKSLNQYIDFFSGTMNSPALRNANIRFREADGTTRNVNADLGNGRHTQFGNVGVQYDADYDGWKVAAKGGVSVGKLHFNALYSTSNPSDANAYANATSNGIGTPTNLDNARKAFGAGVTRLGYAIAGTNGAEVYDPNSASGLVVPAQFRDVVSKYYSTQGDLSVTRSIATGFGTHDLRVGVYGSLYGETNEVAYQDYLLEVKGKPRTLDLIAYNAAGQAVGSVTDNGVLRYTTTLNRGNTDAKMYALYANDTWELTKGLTLDGGVRHERYSYNGYAFATTSANLGDPTTLADDGVRAFTGQIINSKLSPNITNWTGGINYDVTQHLGAYARASHLETPPSTQVTYQINPTIITSKANQYEVGLKAAFGRSYLYLIGFYTRYDPLNASFVALDPVTGRNDQSVPFVGKAEIKGIEIDGNLALPYGFAVTGALTISDPQYKSLVNANGASAGDVEGNQLVREPKVYGNIRPSVDFDVAGSAVQIYGRYEYTGKRYVDFFNNTALPAYQTVGAGITLTHDTWQMQVVGDNLFNAKGLTEGNTRTDQLSGQGTADAIYGRPNFGRNVRLVVSKSW
ncbi:TonB-dependent receptor domain-containing protein [Sphingomonas faeni]|uniref:TonB-dependent receptor domain-containing protein n=1 Tax=Sphingomonas faeni TaxID=185950 RepID=UPI0020C803FB|nr:TonB-dependent receptor [Sphingomonas faeni]MCP8889463.1 TonB-dependent receptor [Sphingomonas faeni]